MKNSRTSKFDGVRAVMILQLVIILLVPFLFTQMGGCQGEKETYPVNLGPEAKAEDLDAALSAPLAGTDPTSIKLGEGYVVSATQELGAGAAFTVLADTSQTVIERTENAQEILLTVIEHKQTYLNGKVQKTSTEIPYRIEKPTAASSGASLTTPDKPEGSDPTAKFRPEVQQMLRERSPTALISSIRSRMVANEAMQAQSGISPSAAHVTYNGLKVSVAKESPPPAVQQADNCMGIPDCKITVHRVSFDMVFWDDNGQPDRVHWDLAMSPEVPFLASMLNKCVTGLASLSGSQGNILVKQCLPVVFFRYEQLP